MRPKFRCSKMILVVFAFLYSSGFAACRTTASPGSEEDRVPLPDLIDNENACELGYFYLLTEPLLTFAESNRVFTQTGSEKQLQCVNCDVDSTPVSANCTMSRSILQEEDVYWHCTGDFPNDDYYIDSVDVKCESQKTKTPRDLQCKRNGSCILRVTTRKRMSRVLYFSNSGMPLWPFLIMGLSLLLFFAVCGAALYRNYLIKKAFMRSTPQQVISFHGGEDCRIHPGPPAGQSVPLTCLNTAPPPYDVSPEKIPQSL